MSLLRTSRLLAGLGGLLQAHKQALAARQELRVSELEQGRARARQNQLLGVIPE